MGSSHETVTTFLAESVTTFLAESVTTFLAESVTTLLAALSGFHVESPPACCFPQYTITTEFAQDVRLISF
jgi:hypothetical protein